MTPGTQGARRADAQPVAERSERSAAPRVEGDALAQVDDLLAAVRAARGDPNLLAGERLKAAQEESKLLAHRARLEHQLTTREATIEALCIRHPRWVELKLALVAAIVPHREAAQAVAEVLRAFGVVDNDSGVAA